jgi:hypothetical protein
MSEIKVRVTLKADSLVDGVIREAGEVVELPRDIAEDFGTLYSTRAGKSGADKSGEKDGDN